MTELNIQERQVSGVTVLDLRGDITIGNGSRALRDEIKRLREEGRRDVLLDLAGVRYIDTSGLGDLISGLTTLRREGGRLKLLNLTERVRDVMVITKLVTVFDIYDEEAAAVRSYH